MLRTILLLPTLLFYLIITLFFLSACSLIDANRQLEIVDSVAEITGDIRVSYPISGSVVVLLFQKKGKDGVVLIDKFPLAGQGRYTFYTKSGRFLIAAYIDSNNDGIHQESEQSIYSGIEKDKPLFFSIKNEKRHDAGTLLFKKGVRAAGVYEGDINLSKANENIGKKVSINDPMFSDDYSSMGLWHPLDFINAIGGGLYLLDEYEKNKIPVLFVHGINGSAKNWTEVISHLDRTHFQPFVLHYASGARLEMVSNYLVKAINELYGKYHFKEFYVVAHSMGGLVSRSFVMKHFQSKHPSKIKLFMTINSPLLGIDSANFGLKYSPILIPSWRDVASNSHFIKTINKWQLPDDTPYHLIFSYLSGEGDDGVVSLESQLPLKLQVESSGVYGFNAGHTKLLKKKEFVSLFNNILNKNLTH